MDRLRVAMCQGNLVVGDIEGNLGRIVEGVQRAVETGCDLAVFPELSITGYPPEDLVLKPSFVSDNRRALEKLAVQVVGCVAVVGFVDAADQHLYNAAAVCADGEVRGVYHKHRLPNYSVFDEQRYFTPGSGAYPLFDVAGVRVGVTICEDAWVSGGPVAEQAALGAEVVVNLNGSPFHRGKVREREEMLAARAVEASCPVVYVNLVGGQDELVFDGASTIVDATGRVVARAPQFEESFLAVDVPLGGSVDEAPEPPAGMVAPLAPDATETYEALVLGTRDYVSKNGFTEVLIGLSGGIDSSLVAAIATDALGADRVHGVLMPSRYSSDHSVSDAERLVANLGIGSTTIAIEPVHAAFLAVLEPSIGSGELGLAGENVQPRIRGTLLMAMSNQSGRLVLTTGNKSELAVGYATLYGDMAGGFAVIKDLPKTLVFELCRDRNRRAGRELIPESVLTKPPSAELRPDQLDTDSLPPYDVLDPILEAYIERDRTAADLVAAGFDEVLVRRVVRMIDLAEYKRRQAPPGPRVTTKAFGKDRRLPITNAYRG
jgi:NAD+ synthase (glutamine-hydrolysing)